MAALFRSASPEANEPRPEFAAELQARLEQELQAVQQPAKTNGLSLLRKSKQPQKSQEPKKQGGVSRRALLTGGAAVAASLVVGAAIDHTVEQGKQSNLPTSTNGQNYNTSIVGEGVETTWHFVTTLAQLGDQAVRFTSDAIIGYVIRDDGDDGQNDPDKGKIIAMSAACTHMGCIVQWSDSDRKFHCPCHGGLFTEYGKVDKNAGRLLYLSALPRLKTKVENGNIYVEVPVSSSSPRGSWAK
jgi:Rieske Fe-S protein